MVEADISVAEPAVLDFSELNSTLDAFLKRFQEFVHSAVAENDNRHAKAARLRDEHEERMRKLEQEREASKAAQKELWETVASERNDDARLRASVQALYAQSASLVQRTAELQSEVSELRARVQSRKRQREDQAARLRLQIKRNAPEREQLEQLTGCHVEPAEDGVLTFVFTLLSESSPKRAVSVSVDVSQTRYAVTAHDTIPAPRIQALVRTLNQTGDFYTFIIGVRKAACEALGT
ncbi:kinetochore-associated Ndc80 complex subunit spc25 [Malassezia cuniculi]|uniref:Kinetochore protein SPC25 n=1 Tax=Malassezia cuniculi TaxID=948313 RepID=A0AAF0F0B9_9BASI|nr:kinetochore-associated Ndc80 complex subunit spc25 [Malassezia cuniculi]